MAKKRKTVALKCDTAPVPSPPGMVTATMDPAPRYGSLSGPLSVPPPSPVAAIVHHVDKGKRLFVPVAPRGVSLSVGVGLPVALNDEPPKSPTSTLIVSSPVSHARGTLGGSCCCRGSVKTSGDVVKSAPKIFVENTGVAAGGHRGPLPKSKVNKNAATGTPTVPFASVVATLSSVLSDVVPENSAKMVPKNTGMGTGKTTTVVATVPPSTAHVALNKHLV